eukprot:6723658-Pyramimonas_sp.AAC.1
MDCEFDIRYFKPKEILRLRFQPTRAAIPPSSDETHVPAQKAKTTLGLNLATYSAHRTVLDTNVDKTYAP